MTILPVADWSVETNRSALSVILRRLDKTIAKIGKKNSIRRRANWNSITNWLTGLYNTLTVFPYIAHLHPVKVGDLYLSYTILIPGPYPGFKNGGSKNIFYHWGRFGEGKYCNSIFQQHKNLSKNVENDQKSRKFC
jgi:hypothetical protein